MLPQHLFLISTLYFVVGEPSQHGEKDKLLSRKRRYLIFPDGSSLQLGEYRVLLLIEIHRWFFDLGQSLNLGVKL